MIEQVLDSTEKAVEHSLASTGRANARAVEIHLESFKTTWLHLAHHICYDMYFHHGGSTQSCNITDFSWYIVQAFKEPCLWVVRVKRKCGKR